jgi:tRNA threonylcarbamoyl adenosine modification protein (Sua5/YciO/YrdC/YwlC family)
VSEDGSDDWRLDEIACLIRDGHVGIIPTDTKYALVCDLESRSGVQTLYDLKGAGASKPMSILCRGFADIDKYTQGFPDNVVPGRTQAFKIAKKCLPGPYTFVLNAGKELPKVCLMDPKSKSKNCKARKTVGVRVSGNPITAALLSRLDRPLLSTTAPANGPFGDEEPDELQDPAVMAESFGEKLAFVVDAGVAFNPPSTVLDLSSATPTLIRRGAGDASLWVEEDEIGEKTDDEDAWGW